LALGAAEAVEIKEPIMGASIPTLVGFTKSRGTRAGSSAGKPETQKRPLKPKEGWTIRVRPQLERRSRDLALFNLDSKLRGCDLVRPGLLERRQFRERAHPDGHIRRQHKSSSAARLAHGRSGVRQTALAAFTTPSSGGWIMFGKSPS
jgi:hypothetical protein